MSPTMQVLIRNQAEAARASLDRIRQLSPDLYDVVVATVEDLQPAPGLGAIDWGNIGTNLIETYALVKSSKEMNEEDRKLAEAELKKLREQNAAIEKQIKLQAQLEKQQQKTLAMQQQHELTLLEHAKLAGGSFMDNLMQRPLLAGGLALLTFALVSGKFSGKKRARA